MAVDELDEVRLREALALAQTAIGVSEPNPRVGCIIGSSDGRILGSGATREVGGAHAEVVAMQAVRASGHRLRGTTAWVTLEPCAHYGRTPPCCDALIDAGLARVVVAAEDPNPRVAGAGIARLRAAGIQVDLAGGEVSCEARELNIGFFSRMLRQRPWVRVKVAASLDGRTALPDGRSQWITGELARADGHAWRRRAGALLTGIGTVLADDPRLDVRLVATSTQPLRIVLDSGLRTPLTARVLAPPGNALIATLPAASAGAEARLRVAGAEVVRLPERSGRVDLSALMTELVRREVNELHVEAGERTNAALLEAGLVDEWLVYLAPLLVGPGLGMLAVPPLPSLERANRLRFVDVVRLGEDLRLRARPDPERHLEP